MGGCIQAGQIRRLPGEGRHGPGVEQWAVLRPPLLRTFGVWRHLGLSGLAVRVGEWEMLLACPGERPGMLLNVRCTDSPTQRLTWPKASVVLC